MGTMIIMVLCVLLVVGLQATLALWVRKDAQKRNIEPGIWTLIVFIAPLYGIILYLVVGRDNPAVGDKIKNTILVRPSIAAIVISAIIFVSAVGGGIYLATGQNSAGNNFISGQNQRGNFTFEESTSRTASVNQLWDMLFNQDELLGTSGDFAINGAWTFNALSANGTATRTARLNENELTAFRVDSINANGDVFLTITQGNTTNTIDISKGFDGYIDMSEFTPGRIRMELNFERVEGVNTAIRWG